MEEEEGISLHHNNFLLNIVDVSPPLPPGQSSQNDVTSNIPRPLLSYGREKSRYVSKRSSLRSASGPFRTRPSNGCCPRPHNSARTCNNSNTRLCKTLADSRRSQVGRSVGNNVRGAFWSEPVVRTLNGGGWGV